jgi:hypothetical protein
METLVGFAVGFLVGTKEGKEGRDRILRSWVAIKESGQVKRMVEAALGLALPIAKDLTRSLPTANGHRALAG